MCLLMAHRWIGSAGYGFNKAGAGVYFATVGGLHNIAQIRLIGDLLGQLAQGCAKLRRR